jgi:hypothetical protein
MLAPMDKAKRDRLVERYCQVIAAVTVALDHIPGDQLDARPEPKAWSAREVTHYLADFELHEGVCLRRMLLENTPVLERWDPPHYVLERLHYHRPIRASLDVFTACGISNVDLLRTLSEEQWRRQGNIQRPWTISVEDDHQRTLRRARHPGSGLGLQESVPKTNTHARSPARKPAFVARAA